MGRNYYQQHPMGDGPGYRPETLTVGELRDRLAALDPGLPVIFRSPSFGAFGSNQNYAVAGVGRETLEQREVHNPATSWIDDESGETIEQEAYTDTLPGWDGVVLI